MTAQIVGKPKVLVLDDEVEICELFELFLANDFDVATLSDSRRAHGLICSQQFDLIVSDIRMPYFTGLDILKRSKESHPKIPFLLMTGHAQTEQDRKMAIDLGAVDVLAKPFDAPHKLVKRFIEIIETSSEPSKAARPDRKKILVIDDESELLEILGIMLEEDYLVTVTTDLEEAKAKVANETFAAIVSDLSMPTVIGVEFIQQLKKASPLTPLLVMSGHGKNDSIVKAAMAAGAIDLIPKPFLELNEVTALLRKYTL